LREIYVIANSKVYFGGKDVYTRKYSPFKCVVVRVLRTSLLQAVTYI